ncbi:PorV/PorQ family protein [Candidatus Desantisbacteria bacterium]|nr:PorV/PorQ family protein [Candidatus Desantisbacteria bacterium]
MKQSIILLFTIISCAVCNAETKYSGLPGEYLNWGVGARAMGMGRAFCGLSDDLSAIYFNPAGLTQIKSGQVTAMTSPLFEGTFYNFLGFGYPTQKAGVLGLGVVLLNSGKLEETNIRQEELGEFKDSRQCVLVSYARRAIPRISYGVNMKLVSQQLASYRDTGIGIDGGLLFSPWNHLSLGLTLKNIISPRLKLKETDEKFPLSIHTGIGARMLDNNLTLTMDVDKTLKKSLQAQIGGEYLMQKRTLALRMGMDNNGASIGFGVKRDKYGLDYSFGSQELGVSHRLSLTWLFDTFGIQLIPEPNVFSPSGKINQTKIKIQARQLEKIKEWSLTILDKQGNTVRHFEGKDIIPASVVWDGKDEREEIVPDGEYSCVLEVTNKTGDSFKSAPSSVFVVSAAPEVSVPMEIGE